jgi:hypothetical protein
MGKVLTYVAALVVGIAIGAVIVGATGGSLGGVTIEDETFVGTVTASDIVINDDLTVTDDATVSGGKLIVTDSNTATSTVEVGCIETKATSTATDIKIYLGVNGSTATTTMYGEASRGILYWGYGSCD